MAANSKFRHTFCPANLKDDVSQQFTDWKKFYTGSQSSYSACSRNWLATAKAGAGGPVVVRALDALGRLPSDAVEINSQRGKVTDLTFNPFVPDMLITGSDDSSIHGHLLEADGTGGIVREEAPLFTLDDGHVKKICHLKCNPVANNVLCSSDWDGKVCLWDISTQQTLNQFENGSNTYSLGWNGNGSLVATTSKDRILRMFDPRAPADAVMTIPDCFLKATSHKLFWVPDYNWIGATGFNKSGKRFVKFWDVGTQQLVHKEKFAADGSGVLVPMYDASRNMLWIWGKGEGSIRFVDVKSSGKIYKESGFTQSSTPTSGGCWMPMNALKTDKCELQRFYCLRQSGGYRVVPLSFIVPRKNEGYHADLYPEVPAAQPALESEAWAAGENSDPVMTSCEPEVLMAAAGIKFEAKKTYNELVEENEQLRARVAELEAQLGIEPQPEAEEVAEN